MKVIISHDVDHLYSREHWFRDLYFEKLWVRETINLLRRRCTLKEWWLRCTSCFHKEINHIRELMEFDRAHGIPSTFFFGMNQGLGMSYRPEEAKSMIDGVHRAGFATGVHGIIYDDIDGMRREHDTFVKLTGREPCGIRMHYVRYSENTFRYLSECGYRFDSTEFIKKDGSCIKEPYQIGIMVEFPISIMDTYLEYDFEQAKARTLKLIKTAQEQEVTTVTVLLHDGHYCESFGQYKAWYEWLTGYCKEQGYQFTSFNREEEGNYRSR